MHVLLISANTLSDPYPVYPLGLDYVAGAIGREHRVQQADLQVMDLPALAALLAEFEPEVIGISCRNIDNTDASDPLAFVGEWRRLIQWLRQRTSATLVCGGSGFTLMPEQVLTRLGADYGIIGEGERFGLLVAALAQGRDPAGIPGVLAPGRSAAFPPPWPGALVRAFRPEPAQLAFYLRHGGMLNLQSKRGCAFRCLYCPYPRIEGGRHRLIEPSAVAETALELQQAGAKYLFFTDSAFNSDIDHSLAVAEALTTHGVSLPWGGFFAPTRLPDNYFARMAASGCRHVEFGTESLADSMLAAYRKPFCSREVFSAHHQARAAGLRIAHYFLFGGPGETAATVEQSLEAIEHLDQAVCFFFLGIRIYPGTGLYDQALAEGQIEPNLDLLAPVYYQSALVERETMAALIRQRSRGRANWLIGSGGTRVATAVQALHDRGLVGPLWEFLAR